MLDCLLVIAGMDQQIILMTFAIKICCSPQAQVVGKSWPVAAADIGVVVQIPDRCLISRRIEQYIILETVAVKVGCLNQFPATGKSWPVAAADVNVVVQIPDRCLIGTGIK